MIETNYFSGHGVISNEAGRGEGFFLQFFVELESSSIELSETNPGDLSDQTAANKKVRQFKAHQSWRVRVAASEAQKLIDTAVQAGANGIEDVSWGVADTEALEAKARGATLEKARTTAAELAGTTGGKLGDLLYASNALNGILGLLAGNRTVQTSNALAGDRGNGFPTPVFSLQLFPEKVESKQLYEPYSHWIE